VELEELIHMQELLRQVYNQLSQCYDRDRGRPVTVPPMGAKVEKPSPPAQLDLFDDFLSKEDMTIEEVRSILFDKPGTQK